MTSSLKRPSLSRPAKGNKIDHYTISFVRARNKSKAHSRVLEAFQHSEMTKKELADMLGKKPEQVTRWLAGPGNMTLETLSDLLFALTGSFFSVDLKDEIDQPKRNLRTPEWLFVGPRESPEKIRSAVEPAKGTYYEYVA